nr:DNA oxidative demethylase [Ipomoea batatas]
MGFWLRAQPSSSMEHVQFPEMVWRELLTTVLRMLVGGRLFAGRYSRAFSVHRKIKRKMKPSTDDCSETSCAADQLPQRKISDDLGKRTRLHIDQNSGDGQKCDSHLGSVISSSHRSKRRTRIDLGTRFELPLDQTEGIGSQKIQGSKILNSLDHKRDSLLPISFGKRSVSFGDNKLKLQKAYSPSRFGGTKRSLVEALNMNEPFDICLSESREAVTLEAPLRRNVMEKQSDVDQRIEERIVLRPGMVLLRNYIPLSEQVSIVKTCQELGLGPGGFYRPGYKDGAKLRLHMMCLGLDWDPQTRRYSKTRQHDNAEPPCIPNEFTSLVSSALRDSHDLIQRHFKTSSPGEILPLITPDVCIVNFYTIEGRLGLHQDRDESPESLHSGLPVVSFSIGDSAEFLYGDESDVQKAEKVLLGSGDVLIFGGKSRHIFHGVTSITPNTAPPALSEVTKLHPGRLNLTFRHY